jgi:hypothetical protein
LNLDNETEVRSSGFVGVFCLTVKIYFMKHVLENEDAAGTIVRLTLSQVQSDKLGLDLLVIYQDGVDGECIPFNLNKKQLFDLIGSLHHFQKQLK